MDLRRSAASTGALVLALACTLGACVRQGSAADVGVAVPGTTTTTTAGPASPAAAAPTSTAGPATAAATTTVPVATTAAPTTAAPTTPAPVTPGRVVLVGDSVMAALNPEYTDAARKVLGPAGWKVAIDAKVNRSTIQGGQVLRSLGVGPSDTVVVMLGHNDAGTPSVFAPRVEAVLDELAGVSRVFWLTMREPRYAQANAVLAAAAASHPNLHLIPWAASIQPGWTAKDGLHLNGSGATGMAQLILASISH